MIAAIFSPTGAPPTGIDRSFALCDGLCKTITARVTTATAVVAWQLFTNSCLFFIYFNFKFRAEQTKAYTDDDADCRDHDSSDND